MSLLPIAHLCFCGKLGSGGGPVMEYSDMSTATGRSSSKRVVGRKGSEYLLFVSWLRCIYLVADGGIGRCAQEGIRTHEIVACQKHAKWILGWFTVLKTYFEIFRIFVFQLCTMYNVQRTHTVHIICQVILRCTYCGISVNHCRSITRFEGREIFTHTNILKLYDIYVILYKPLAIFVIFLWPGIL